jgi:hypothetical protein
MVHPASTTRPKRCVGGKSHSTRMANPHRKSRPNNNPGPLLLAREDPGVTPFLSVALQAAESEHEMNNGIGRNTEAGVHSLRSLRTIRHASFVLIVMYPRSCCAECSHERGLNKEPSRIATLTGFEPLLDKPGRFIVTCLGRNHAPSDRTS